ncbi:hypothetical protein FT643_17695 [Ketobacter sp. MCCC 1A13808]|uniref:hypothetical protein n=1 Tax=Ketobacter sp. MCCC 1A13808 TaxID=2602738 RepID=UPI0012EC4679|nr:hypothetical protein [Ketobacter sp. MCCC 1A13808]MVF13977.1 hypothetical protein [Ketobacter sp. MCCC 1A13808]
MVTSSQADSLHVENLTHYDQVVFQISYHHLPITLSFPSLEALNKDAATMKIGLGKMAYCDEFLALKNPLDYALGVATENLNFRIPETVASLNINVGETLFKGELQVIKEVCDYEGDAYVLYHLVPESGFVSDVPLTENLLTNLQSTPTGTFEVKYSTTKEFDSNGVLEWDASEIRRYAAEAMVRWKR